MSKATTLPTEHQPLPKEKVIVIFAKNKQGFLLFGNTKMFGNGIFKPPFQASPNLMQKHSGTVI